MRKSVRVIVPATSANCGPGFDVLGAACNLYNEFTYELTERGFELEVTGEGSGRLHASGKNLAFLAFFRLWNELTDRRYTGLKVTMHNRIPLSRGLGSSSTAIVAGLMAANYLTGSTLTRQQLVDYATEIEGHPDNVAPALLGGFTVSYMAHGKAASLRFVPKKPLSFIAAVPAEPLSTARARQAIPETVSHKDAVFNAGRSALLVSALLTGEYKFLPDALGAWEIEQGRAVFRGPRFPYSLTSLPCMEDRCRIRICRSVGRSGTPDNEACSKAKSRQASSLAS